VARNPASLDINHLRGNFPPFFLLKTYDILVIESILRIQKLFNNGEINMEIFIPRQLPR